MADSKEAVLPPEALEALKGKDYVVVGTVLGPVAFRGLSRPEYQRFQGMIRDPKTAIRAGEQACLLTILHPSLVVFETMIDRKPGILAKCADAVLEFSGVDIEAEVKKVESEFGTN